jgi:hypothetical protein
MTASLIHVQGLLRLKGNVEAREAVFRALVATAFEIATAHSSKPEKHGLAVRLPDLILLKYNLERAEKQTKSRTVASMVPQGASPEVRAEAFEEPEVSILLISFA